eukprot:GILI01008933.1.p3 GENE.GILI01008933.1~~GILI01008933.1.p3  ORF type:complete len:122 (-),score=40.05 GILI01008933.1:88-453(-)
MIQFFAWNSGKRRGSHLMKFGPLYCSILALPLIMADLTRHVLLDAGLIDLVMFNDDDSLTWVGIVFTIICTWSGYFFLFAAALWQANIHLKIQSGIQWCKKRRAARKAADRKRLADAQSMA